mmetsp:Transcript_130540/g.194412  ORF Transcript_130540/g.194412 Transcript_130540/m.194412 type:complete len:208 (+) Transcript_130540:748-1371(+)
MRSRLPRKRAREPLVPGWPANFSAVAPLRGSTMRMCLSLQVVNKVEPVKFQSSDWIDSPCSPSMACFSCAVAQSQRRMSRSKEAEARTLSATGLNSNNESLRRCPFRTAVASFMFSLSPPSGIVQILTVVSSDAVATMLSLKGEKSQSTTSLVWPVISGGIPLILPSSSHRWTQRAPPPPRQETAKNLPLALMCWGSGADAAHWMFS